MSVLINADTSDGLKFTSDTSGEIKLQSGGTDIATVNSSGITMASGKTLPASALTGDIIQNAGPAFKVNLSANQAISNATSTKLQLDTEQFDTTGDYDTTTYTFTPSVAGYYQVNLQSYSSAINNGTSWFVFIYKNGSSEIRGSRVPQGALGPVQSVASGLVYMNGTTDYLEFYVYHNHGGSRDANSASNQTEASGILIQKA